jgi:hypothetical protein
MAQFRIVPDAGTANEDTDRIIASEAFKTINLLIDHKTQRLIMLLESIRTQMKGLVGLTNHIVVIDTRTERENGHNAALPLDLNELKFLTETVRVCERLDAEIAELQRLKAHLLSSLSEQPARSSV